MATLAQTRAAELVSPYLEQFYLAVGRATVNVYFRDCTEAVIARILTSSPSRAQAAVERVLSAPSATPHSITRRLPYASVIRISLLEDSVRAAPDLKGILLEDALTLLEAKFNSRIKPRVLQEFLRRTSAHHSLTVRGGRVRLKSEMVVEILRERHLRQQEREKEGG